MSDLDRSIEFFRRILGFELDWNAGSICSVSRDGSNIMLQVQERVAPCTVWISLDGDELFESVEGSGAEILQAQSNNTWAFEMKLADPDGNSIWLGAEPEAGCTITFHWVANNQTVRRK